MISSRKIESIKEELEFYEGGVVVSYKDVLKLRPIHYYYTTVIPQNWCLFRTDMTNDQANKWYDKLKEFIRSNPR